MTEQKKRRQFAYPTSPVSSELDALTVVMKTETFSVLANQRTSRVSRNAGKNLKNNGKNIRACI